MSSTRTRTLVAAILAVVLVCAAAPAFAASTDVPLGDFPNTVIVSRDATRAYSVVAVAGGPGRLVAVDTTTDEIVGDVTVGVEPRDAVVSADGTRIYVSNINDNTISVIDAASFTVVETWPVPGAPATEGAWGLALSEDGERLYVSVRFGDRVEVMSTVDGSEVREYSAPNLPAGIQLDEDAGYLYVARSATSLVRRIDLATGDFVEAPIAAGSPFLMTLSPDGSELWVVPFGGTQLFIYDTASFTVTDTIDLGGTPRRPDFVASGRIYVPVDRDGGVVAVVDAATHDILGMTSVGGAPQDLAVLPDAQHAYSANLFGAGLTFFGPPIVVTHPADSTVEDGATATFSVTTRATVDSIVWQKSTDGGATWQDVPGETTTSLSVEAALADDGALFRVVLHSELFGDATSNVGRLTVLPVLAPTGADVTGALELGASLLVLGLALFARSRRLRTR